MKYLFAAALLTVPLAVPAQSSCSSDGQPRPVALLERFINADCVSCWSDTQAPTGPMRLPTRPGSPVYEKPLSAGS